MYSISYTYKFFRVDSSSLKLVKGIFKTAAYGKDYTSVEIPTNAEKFLMKKIYAFPLFP